MTRENSIRKEILFQAFAKRPLSVTASGIAKQCRKEQMDFSELEIRRELPYLVGKKALARVTAMDASEPAYEITAEGIDYYEQNYAA